jgi:ribosome-associated translation inhibitor RaiA
VEIIFHAHNASIPDALRTRAEAHVRKFARRLQRAVDAVIRFENDGPTRRVEIVLHAPRSRNLIAEGRSRSYAAALKDAVLRLQSQIPKKNPARTRVRATALALRSA